MEIENDSAGKAGKMFTIQLSAKQHPLITRSFGGAYDSALRGKSKGKKRAFFYRKNYLQSAEQTCLRYTEELLLKLDKSWERFVQDKCTFDLKNLSESEIKRQNACYKLYSLKRNYNNQQ